MLSSSLSVIIAYLIVGVLACFLARRGWPQDWDEALLAAIVGPPLLAALAAAAAAGFVWHQLQANGRRPPGR